MPLILDELLALAFLTKSFIQPNFKGELLIFFSWDMWTIGFTKQKLVTLGLKNLFPSCYG